MIQVEFKNEISKMNRLIRTFGKQATFATAVALTKTAKRIKIEEEQGLTNKLNKPTPFTRRGFYIRSARKTNLVSVVGIKDIQVKYLDIQIDGGIVKPKKRALLAPANIRLNKYGNVPRKRIKTLLSRSDVFSGTIKGVPGIWQRTRNKGVKLLVRYEDQIKYKKRFPFYKIAQDEASRALNFEFKRAFRRARATAR